MGPSYEIDGAYFTVNPIAVNSSQVNVFTENKRVVLNLHSPEFGWLVMVAIGATMVGSIIITAAEGETVERGDEIGIENSDYFANRSTFLNTH